MVHQLRRQDLCLARVAHAMIVVFFGSCLAASLRAEPGVHFNHPDSLPPGAIGNEQLQRGGPLPGYFQPVEIRGPRGLVVTTAETGDFADPRPAPLVVGMMIGPVYRLRITQIPNQEGLEVYPTIEVINRLYPPMGLEYKFPIPVELTQEELEMALDGRFVTRVIYLEEPYDALPVAQSPTDQSYFEAGDGENPLDVADALGRPMAILRMGARVPDSTGPDARFLYGSPPIMKWKPTLSDPGGYPQIEPFAQRNQSGVRQATATSTRRVPVYRGKAAR
jgi:hypothetical protein